MMAQAGLSECYCAEVVATAAYLRNRTPTRSLREKTTPYEKWYGRKPDLSHLRVFGCMAYAYIPDSNRKGKLSKKAEKLRFIGCSLQRKGYRLIDENTSKVIIRRDVIFNESDFQHDSTTVKVNDGVTVSDHEKGVLPEEEEEPMEQPQPEEPENQEEDQHRYPRRQNIAPIRYGIDEFVDTALLGGGQIEEPQSIEEVLEGKLSEK